MRIVIKKTRAAILSKLKQDLVIDNILMPENLLEGQVLVKMIYSGVCGSQLGEIQGIKGPDKFLPHLLGHEGIGRVLQIGPKVKKVKKNNLVLLHWMKGSGFNAAPPKYYWRDKVLNAGCLTTFNEHAVVAENRLTKINSKTTTPLTSLFGCTMSTAIGSVKNLCKIKNENKVLVVGCGPIGLAIIKYLKFIKIKEIYAIDIDQKKLLLAKKYGATKIYKNKKNYISDVSNLDFIFECTGNTSIITSAFEQLNTQGTLILIGVPFFKNRAKFNTLDINLGKKILGSKGGQFNVNRDLKNFTKIVNSKTFNKYNYKLNIFKFSQINRIFKLMKNKRLTGKAIIKF